MKAKEANILKLISIVLIIQAMTISTVAANDDEIDADFLEFLADMEEATGSGFEAWLNDDSEDQFSTNSNEETEFTEQHK